MAFPYATLGRSGRAASAVRLYRQTTAQIRTGNGATFYRSLSGTHAGAVRTYELLRGDYRAGMHVKRETVISRQSLLIFRLIACRIIMM